MNEEAKTREKLLEAAKADFLENGYQNASLRRICKNAGVTTGALYFFFENKEALLNALIEQPLQAFRAMFDRLVHLEMSDPGAFDPDLIHVIASMRFYGYLEILHGDYPQEKAVQLAKTVGTYADAGFAGLVNAKKA